MPEPLANPPGEMKPEYQVVVIGSGYGGAITAARLAEAGKDVCILERGKEWIPGTFPDSLSAIAGQVRSPLNRLGLYEFVPGDDVDVFKGSGLGGTSLINANVAIRPDPELFEDPRWPQSIRDAATSGVLATFYDKASVMLGVNPHPTGLSLKKVQALQKGALTVPDSAFGLLDVAVSFTNGPNHVGVEQKECINCGDCVTGCNVRAKNTLYMNYLPFAKQKGVAIFVHIEVSHVEKNADGTYRVLFRRNTAHNQGAIEVLKARNVVLASGTLGSSEILLRSKEHGLAVSPRLGKGVSGNGDFFGIAYNGGDVTDIMGFGNHEGSPRSAVIAGPTIVSTLRHDRSQPFASRITFQDLSIPLGLVDVTRRALPKLAFLTGQDTDFGFIDRIQELAAMGRDFLPGDPSPQGALNHSMVYLVMGIDSAQGEIVLNSGGTVKLKWPGVAEEPIFNKMNVKIREQAQVLGSTFIENFRWSFLGGRNLITVHPLGGCSIAETSDQGVVDDRGRVFDGSGGIHGGLYVVDGAIVPTGLGVNPFMTISALAELIAEKMPQTLAP